MEDILLQGLKELDIDDSTGGLSRLLLLYSNEIKMFNRVFNLVKVKDDAELAVLHILDSLAAYRFFEREINFLLEKNLNKIGIADVGSGAGFPGIPLACFFLLRQNLQKSNSTAACREIEFTLIERMKKRCGFLQNVKAVLKLSNTQILETEAERAPKNTFDIVTCRAFRTLDKHILHTLLNCKKTTGKLFLYKATTEKISDELVLLEKENLNFKIEKLTVPFLNRERNLLINRIKIAADI